MPSDYNGPKDEKLTSKQEQAAGFNRQFAMAMELPFVIVAAMVVGGLVGYFLDHWLHTKPFLMLVFGLLGFFGGLREVFRRVSKQ
jgi:ATP synthase protein I